MIFSLEDLDGNNQSRENWPDERGQRRIVVVPVHLAHSISR